MQFKRIATASPRLDPQLQWLLYAGQRHGFIFGDANTAFAIPAGVSVAPTPLPGTPVDTGVFATYPCNLPIPRETYDELIEAPWHGFRFLDYDAYVWAKDAKGHPVGDMLRTIIFGPDYGHYVAHPATGMIFALRGGSIEMLKREPTGFASVEKTKTRGRAALAFAAHPAEGLIAYGDNFGTFHAQRFTPDGFGKASKIAAKERKASRLEFIQAGRVLAIGGMGYLEAYSYASGKFAPLHQVEMAVRDFHVLGDGERFLVNQGLHGISAFGYGSGGFTKLGEVRPGGAVRQIAVSSCQKYFAASEQDSGIINLYEMIEQ